MRTRKISGVEVKFFAPCLPKNHLYLICLILFLLFPFSFFLYLSMCLVYVSPNGVLNSQSFAGDFIEILHYRLHTVSGWISHKLVPALPIPSTVFKEVTIGMALLQAWGTGQALPYVSYIPSACQLLSTHMLHPRETGKLRLTCQKVYHFKSQQSRIKRIFKLSFKSWCPKLEGQVRVMFFFYHWIEWDFP